MFTLIDNLLNRITMYRLMLYYLIALIAIAAIFGGFGILPYNPAAIILSSIVALAVCWLANKIFAKAFGVPTNAESFFITAFILALIIPPITIKPLGGPTFWSSFAFLTWASLFAMASKYLLAANRKHIFNPAGIAVVITAFALNQYASWWVGGNLPMLAFVVIGGLLIMRKIQRFDLVIAFLIAALVSIVLTSPGFDFLTTLEKALVHTSLLFFAFVMLTEPLTTPPTRPLRIAYGALTGALFSPAIHVGQIYSTPELALIVGNIFSFAVSPKVKYLFTLKSKKEVSEGIYDFAFTAANSKNKKVSFRPGQYMEFTLATPEADSRGNRRYFTVASSPTEPELHLGVKFYNPSSSFKQKLLALEPGDTMLGGQLAGDFTLPRGFDGANESAAKKFVFIAGGIGITPFRSMVKYLSDRAKEDNDDAGARTKKPNIVLLYSNRLASEIAYTDIFDEAARTIGLKTVYAITDTKESAPGKNFHSGRIDAELIKREIPDFRERVFYISGTHAMVVAFEKVLRHDLGMPRTQIKTDFFPGFA